MYGYNAAVALVVLTVLAGCQTTQPMVTETDYARLRDGYFSYGNQRVELVCDPILCRGLAGDVGGIGGHVSVVPVRLADGSVIMGLITSTENVKSGEPVWGHFVFISGTTCRRTKDFAP